jgi:hypothetical protein
MLDTKVEISVGGSFDPVPADKYVCQIVDVNAVRQFNKFKNEEETRLNYQFVILDDKKEDDKLKSLRGRFLWKRTSLSLHEKSWLFKLASGVAGKPLTQEEKEKFDPESLVGKRVDCMVEQKPSADGSKIWNNVISFSKASPKGCVGQKLEDFDFQPKPKEIEKTSSPAVAPKEEVVDDFIKGLEEDKKNSK